jgi:ribosomal protein RSM22 (predicted rRNA methylase)
MQTFLNLPEKITQSIEAILAQPENSQWLKRAEALHTRYTEGKRHPQESYLKDSVDIAAYLGMRVPATYAQIAGALSQVKEAFPEFKVESVLDLGSGPGTAVWSAKEVYSTLKKATCIDNEGNLLSLGREIFRDSGLDVEISWEADSLRSDFGSKNHKFDLVIIANVLNELTEEERINVVNRAFTQCSGILVILESGTPKGAQIVEKSYQDFENKNFLIAPFMNNSFIEGGDYWIHFAQRFIRPEFQRRVRQQMRISSLMASDWEETKYSYIALSKYQPKKTAWGRLLAPIKKQKAWFDITVLTAKGIEKLQVFKRDKEKYNLVRKLKWGDIVESELVNQRIS